MAGKRRQSIQPAGGIQTCVENVRQNSRAKACAEIEAVSCCIHRNNGCEILQSDRDAEVCFPARYQKDTMVDPTTLGKESRQIAGRDDTAFGNVMFLRNG